MKHFLRTWILPALVGGIVYFFLPLFLGNLVAKLLMRYELVAELLQIAEYSKDQQVQEIYVLTRYVPWLGYMLSGFVTIFLIKDRSWQKKIVFAGLIYLFNLVIMSIYGLGMALYLALLSVPFMPGILVLIITGMYVGDFLLNRQYLRLLGLFSLAVFLLVAVYLLRQIPGTPLAIKITEPNDPLLLEIKQELLIPYCLAGLESGQDLAPFFTQRYLDRTADEGRMRRIDGRSNLIQGSGNVQTNLKYDHEYLFLHEDGLTCDSLTVSNRQQALKRRELLEPTSQQLETNQYYFSFKPFSNVVRHVTIEKTDDGWKFDHISGTN